MRKENEFNIEDVMAKVKELRNGGLFTSERDFQFILGVAIRELYKTAIVVMEYYNPSSNENKRQYIDILVIMNNKYYPIELKYKHKKNNIKITDNLDYKLSDETCTTDHRKKYCEDIKRLIELQNSQIQNFNFAEGYAILLTNYEQFRNGKLENQYLLSENKIKENNGVNEINKINEKYKNTYDMKWYNFDEQNKFSYLITTIKKNNKI